MNHATTCPWNKNVCCRKTRARLVAEGSHGEAEIVTEVRHALAAPLVVEQDLHHLTAVVLAARHAADQVVRQEAALRIATCSTRREGLRSSVASRWV